jgi:uncharacterized protein with FMN-binding domain
LVSSVASTVGVAAVLAHADDSAAATSSTLATTGATPVTAASSGETATTTTYADGVYTGSAQWTRWGNVQVQVTIENGRITAVDEVQAPSDGKSVAINSRAQPILESEAVAAQSANIDAVSGATYTSATYKASLQAALDQAAQAATAAS